MAAQVIGYRLPGRRICAIGQHVSHCESWFLHNSQTHTRKGNKLSVFSLWVMWAVVSALFNRAKYGALHQPYNTLTNLWF